MAKGPEQLRLTPDERADLVAFLDGELPEAQARNISTKLTLSATARREAETLEQTWKLLDALPRPKLADDFAEKTVLTIHQIEMRSSVWGATAAVWARRVLLGALYAGVGAAAFGAAFWAVRNLWPNPLERLADHLAIAEHLDEYLEIGSVQFLNDLMDSKDFGPASQ